MSLNISNLTFIISWHSYNSLKHNWQNVISTLFFFDFNDQCRICFWPFWKCPKILNKYQLLTLFSISTYKCPIKSRHTSLSHSYSVNTLVFRRTGYSLFSYQWSLMHGISSQSLLTPRHQSIYFSWISTIFNWDNNWLIRVTLFQLALPKVFSKCVAWFTESSKVYTWFVCYIFQL